MTPALLLAIIATAGSAAAADPGQTCGLVTGLRGRAFLVNPEVGSVVEVRSPGVAVPCGHEMLTADGAAARITAIKGNHFIVGSAAHLTFVEPYSIDVSVGAVAVDQRESTPVRLTSAALVGETSGIAVLWTGGVDAQWLSLRGDSRVWHPQLPVATVTVRESLFTETTRSSHYLDPRSAREPDVTVAQRFAASFGDEALRFVHKLPAPVVAKATPVAPAPVKRAPASVKVVSEADPAIVAAKPATSVVTGHKEQWSNKDFLDRLQAHIQGEDYDEDAALAAKRQVKVDPATARRIKEASKRKAMVGRREDAFKAALAQGPEGVKVGRAIASEPAAVVEQKAVPYPEELERENVNLVDKLIRSGGKARRP